MRWRLRGACLQTIGMIWAFIAFSAIEPCLILLRIFEEERHDCDTRLCSTYCATSHILTSRIWTSRRRRRKNTQVVDQRLTQYAGEGLVKDYQVDSDKPDSDPDADMRKGGCCLEVSQLYLWMCDISRPGAHVSYKVLNGHSSQDQVSQSQAGQQKRESRRTVSSSGLSSGIAGVSRTC